MPRLNDVNITFSQGDQKKTVLDHLSLEFPVGKTTVVMGPSGCGKTTLLRLIAGIISPTLGNVARETDRVSFLFQDTALLPWLTAEENVNLVLSDSKKTLPVAKEWLALVGLTEEGGSFPAALSGGMQQRVALARALAFDAELLLLDEPFRGMDEALHEQMRELIRTVCHGKTTILVTHDKNDLDIADFSVTLNDISPIIHPVKH